ncbi:hypothetical protein BVC71_13565 [Marivivens niveibacter]|uniref:MobA/VirD2-like nuclease domain-containing protein n=1 Tax=Marivivens niveibacter TaxID=1930667 RepID=A0A251WW80_9RHOB|nr:relaxase/mobilization nuclease domain-containing protein [Marivivens niveibacter]OUD08521.1 hypothetical protein BVC71_13565 [Marivivens niveibacter]
MIGTLHKTTSPERLVSYLSADSDKAGSPRPRADLVMSNVGTDPRQIARHLRALTQLRPDIRKPLSHIVLAAAPNDRAIPDPIWRKIVRTWCKKMGYESFAAFCHGTHVHIVASRVLVTRRLVSDRFDYRRSEAVIRALEKRFGLKRTASSHLLDSSAKASHVTAPCHAELALAEDGQLSAKRYIQTALTELTSLPMAISDVVEALAELGVKTRTRFGKAGKILGFSFRYAGYVFRGSSLGHAFTQQSFIQKGITYDKDKELEKLKQANALSQEKAVVSANCEAQQVDPAGHSASAVDVKASRKSAGGNSPAKQNHQGRKGENPDKQRRNRRVETRSGKTETRPKAPPDSMRSPSPDDDLHSFLHLHRAKQGLIIDSINWTGFSQPEPPGDTNDNS